MIESNLVSNSVDKKPVSISCTVYPEPLDIWFDIPPSKVIIKYYFIYKTTNLLNGKIYVGKHETKDDPNDDYLGSGVWLDRVINKHGKENFAREIIEFCTEENVYKREEYWIAELKAQDPNIGYNISNGGEGGPNFKNHHHSEKSKEIISEKLEDYWDDPEAHQQHSEKMVIVNNDPEKCQQHSEFMEDVWDDPEYRYQQHESHKDRIWIYNPELDVETLIKQNEAIPDGFIKCRRPASEEHRRNSSKASKGRIVIYNSELGIEKRIQSGEKIPEGYKRGRKKQKQSECRKDKIWIHNQELNIEKLIKFYEQIPDGFIKGRRKR